MTYQQNYYASHQENDNLDSRGISLNYNGQGIFIVNHRESDRYLKFSNRDK